MRREDSPFYKGGSPINKTNPKSYDYCEDRGANWYSRSSRHTQIRSPSRSHIYSRNQKEDDRYLRPENVRDPSFRKSQSRRGESPPRISSGSQKRRSDNLVYDSAIRPRNRSSNSDDDLEDLDYTTSRPPRYRNEDDSYRNYNMRDEGEVEYANSGKQRKIRNHRHEDLQAHPYSHRSRYPKNYNQRTPSDNDDDDDDDDDDDEYPVEKRKVARGEIVVEDLSRKHMSQELLHDVFCEFGEVLSILPDDINRRAFVTFADESSAIRASSHMNHIQRRPVTVRLLDPLARKIQSTVSSQSNVNMSISHTTKEIDGPSMANHFQEHFVPRHQPPPIEPIFNQQRVDSQPPPPPVQQTFSAVPHSNSYVSDEFMSDKTQAIDVARRKAEIEEKRKRLMDLYSSSLRELVKVFSDPKTSPEEKKATKALIDSTKAKIKALTPGGHQEEIAKPIQVQQGPLHKIDLRPSTVIFNFPEENFEHTSASESPSSMDAIKTFLKTETNLKSFSILRSQLGEEEGKGRFLLVKFKSPSLAKEVTTNPQKYVLSSSVTCRMADEDLETGEDEAASDQVPGLEGQISPPIVASKKPEGLPGPRTTQGEKEDENEVAKVWRLR
eukprot:GHVP01012050.1.p1 GENE.GHVP01012050.1~~GHVP01012050.1.p1  ORF type:complete len:610 (-),score=114.78 GHVP01012050.1:67-1896(-)